jgi:hypothetical protein
MEIKAIEINLLFPWILIVGDYATTINLESAKAQINGQFDISLDLSPKTSNIGDESKADISAKWAKGMVCMSSPSQPTPRYPL